MRTTLLVGVTLLLLLSAAAVRAEVAWIQLDDPPPEGPDPQVDDPADWADLYYGPDYDDFYARGDLVAPADVGNYTYAVYLDHPVGGDFGADYRIVHGASGSTLDAWDGTAWVTVADANVTEDPTNASLVFQVAGSLLGGLGGENLKIWFESYEGSDALSTVADRAPNGGSGYLVTRRTIPNLPGLVLPVFVAAVGTVVGLLWWRRVRTQEESL